MQTLRLHVLWLKSSLGLAVNQQTIEGSVPLTPYYFWPVTEAWEQLRFELDSKSWILEEDRVKILNQIVDIMNDWQQARLNPDTDGTPNDSLIERNDITIVGLS